MNYSKKISTFQYLNLLPFSVLAVASEVIGHVLPETWNSTFSCICHRTARAFGEDARWNTWIDLSGGHERCLLNSMDNPVNQRRSTV